MFRAIDYINASRKGFSLKATLTQRDGTKVSIPGFTAEFTPAALDRMARGQGENETCSVNVATGVSDVKGRPVSFKGKASGNAVAGLLAAEFASDETPASEPSRNGVHVPGEGESVKN